MLDLPDTAAYRSALVVSAFDLPGRRGGGKTDDVMAQAWHDWSCVRPALNERPATGLGSDAINQAQQDFLKEVARRQMQTQIEDRLRELHVDALLTGEPFCEGSLADFHVFVDPLRLAIRPSIFLLDNGNLRGLWKNETNEQVGLQFLGRGAVQFVMFALRKNPRMMMRDFGVDAISAIRERIRANDCDHLLFG
jgi:hypothetical protein